jgi:hypothetical protein
VNQTVYEILILSLITDRDGFKGRYRLCPSSIIKKKEKKELGKKIKI